jgi:ATP-binding cassette, subfamily B, bacterial
LNDRSKAHMLWHHSQGFRHYFLLAIVAMTVGYLMMFGVPLVMKYAIDIITITTGNVPPAFLEVPTRLLSAGDEPSIMLYLIVGALIILVLTLGAGICLYIRGRLIAVGSEGIVRALRDRVFYHLEHLPAGYHDRTDTGDLVQRCTSDVETVRVFLAGQVVEISRAILMLLVVLPILFSLDVDMAWLSLATIPLLFVFAFIFFQKVKTLFLLVDEAEARLTTVLQENLTGIRVVRAFARQSFEQDKFAEKNRVFRDLNNRLIKILGVYYGLSDLICLSQIGLLLIVGALWVVDGFLSVGTLFAFITYESMIIWPIRHMGRVLTDSGKAIVSMGRLAEVLAEPAETQHEAFPTETLHGEIEFSQVSFGYAVDKPVLNAVSFHLQAGQTLALLGPPGSGKSTVAQLLMRLYDYTEGSILLDGLQLNALARKYVRGQISIVLQEPFLYAASIGANLLVGRLSASQAEVEEAAQAACIHDSITSLPRGYDTRVGERGATLSGGQRQRIALARALLKNPPILILDDALSAVDTDTEARILAALKARRSGHTTIIIAHRLSSVMHADQILMFDNGRIIQSGNHESLSQQPGVYQQLCQIQGAIQEQIEAALDDEATASANVIQGQE